MRGLYRHPAKVLSVEIWTVGSNPTPSTKYNLEMKSYIETINIGEYSFDLHKNPGVVCSGGADSSILLYILMKFSKSPINIYSLASKEKFRSVARTSHMVISKCMDLTSRSDVNHHILYTDVQNNQLLFSKPNFDLKNNVIDIVYTGITLIPPLDICNTFINPVSYSIVKERDPSKVHTLYLGPYYRPFINMNKRQIKKLYDTLDVTEKLFPITRSCESYTQDNGHCGNGCWWCEERFWGFGRLS